MLELVERAECRVALYVIRMAMYISIPRTLVLIHSGPSCESTHSQRPCPIFSLLKLGDWYPSATVPLALPTVPLSPLCRISEPPYTLQLHGTPFEF